MAPRGKTLVPWKGTRGTDIPQDPRGPQAAPAPVIPAPYTEAPIELQHEWTTHQNLRQAPAPAAPSQASVNAARFDPADPRARAASSKPAPRREPPAPVATFAGQRLAHFKPAPEDPLSRAAPQDPRTFEHADLGELRTAGPGALSTKQNDMVLHQWGSGGVDFKTPSGIMHSDSAYHKLKRETESGMYTTSWGRQPVGDVYVPPWELTRTEIYGADMVKQMDDEGKESYLQRAARYAKEEAARRASGDRHDFTAL